jgi:hypothetical protein
MRKKYYFNQRREKYCALQKPAVEDSRLGIPLLFGHNVLHGFKTVFPISLGKAASWDTDAIEQSAQIKRNGGDDRRPELDICTDGRSSARVADGLPRVRAKPISRQWMQALWARYYDRFRRDQWHPMPILFCCGPSCAIRGNSMALPSQIITPLSILPAVGELNSVVRPDRMDSAGYCDSRRAASKSCAHCFLFGWKHRGTNSWKTRLSCKEWCRCRRDRSK